MKDSDYLAARAVAELDIAIDAARRAVANLEALGCPPAVVRFAP
jgi:hypothetical protein